MTDVLTRLASVLGTRYRLDRELGQGGMATVYLAEDLKHRRRVALKVLRPELAAIIGGDRFLKEIEVTANLQHPNILPLYDSGEADSFLYYVMPFVEGESLRDKLTREKQLGVEEAIGIARAVAAALEFAHRHGVVHRDIKPENILIQSGQALVADFGIALAVSQAGGSRMTETGMSLGTPHYMSPEQATGDRTLDARSDVYALGCVTYEMLAGEPPYLGNTAQAIVAKILTETPTPVRRRRESVPVHVEAAIQMALAKLPADRFATAAEFGNALVNPGFTIPGTAGIAVVAQSDGRWKRLALAAFGVAIVLAGAALWGWLRPFRLPPATIARTAIALPPGEQVRLAAYGRFAISRDGQKLAYASTRQTGGAQLVVRELSQLRATPIYGSEVAYSPFFSPDGNSVAFFTGSSLKAVSLTGAPPVTVADSGVTALGGDWGEDGFIYASSVNGLVRISQSGGPIEHLTTRDERRGDFYHGWPQLLPGGKAVVFSIMRPTIGQREVTLLDLGTRKIRPLLKGVFPRYVPGYLLFIQEDGSLAGVPFDVARLEPTGPPVALLDNLGFRTYGVSDLAVSQSGTLLYMPGSAGTEYLSWVTRAGTYKEIDPSWTADFITHALSPDGKRLVVSMLKEGPRDLWIKELDQGPLTRLTFEGQVNERPEWSRDGKSITFISDRGGTTALYRQLANGVGKAELLIGAKQEPRSIAEGFLSPDGVWVVFRTASSEAGAGDILGLRIGIDSAPVPLVATTFSETQPVLSPDGKWLAYTSNESSRNEIFVRPFPNTGDGRWQVSIGGGHEPVWAHNGKELFYKSETDHVMVATLTTTPSFAVQDRRTLFSATDYDTDTQHARFNLSPDDQRLVMSRKSSAAQTELILVLNWFEELKARMGVKR